MATRTQQNGRSIVCALSLKLNPSVTNSPAVRRACCVLRFINESGAKGCEVVVSGKLSGQRAKSMEFVDGFMIHSGDPCYDYVETATGHVLLRQGVLGIKVKITNYDPKSKIGPRKPLPNVVEPKEEEIYETTETEYKMPAIVPIYDEAADI